jgi:putative zinc finger/helix-turn-helix YgiT family protein
METHRENYQYTACGLRNITLYQVQVDRCPHCGETEVVIPAVEKLHKAIADALIRKKTRLAPEEIRYLRKYLGWSSIDFAAYMGVSQETVSRWENSSHDMASTADRLLRMLVLTKTPVWDYSADFLKEIGAHGVVRPIQFDWKAETEWTSSFMATV